MWQPSKTDWVSTDTVFLEDWQRWVNNALYLYKLLDEPFQWLDCSLNSRWAIPYYYTVNRLETDLLQLMMNVRNTGRPYSRVVWYPALSPNWEKNPSYVDFNRWEQLELDLFRRLTSVHARYSGTFTAGQNRIRQSLGRR